MVAADLEELQAAALEAHPVPTLIVEASGRVVVANAAARGRRLGSSWAGLWAAPDEAARALASAVSGSEATFDDPGPEQTDQEGRGHSVRLSPLAGPNGRSLALCTVTPNDPARAAEERILGRTGEMNHRIRNLMTMVLAVARATGRRAVSLETFLGPFTARLESMARTQDLLARGASGEAIALRDLVAG